MSSPAWKRARPARHPAGRWGIAWCAAIVAAAALHAAGPIWDTDLFWHLEIGKLTLAAGHLLTSDPLTFTIADGDWIQHEWGGQVLLALVARLDGFGALRLAQAGLVSLFLTLVAVAFHRSGGRRAPLTAGLVALAWIGAEPNASLRPHLFGWILAAALFGLFWPVRPERPAPRELLGLVLFTALWVNLHASALLAPLVAGAAGLDAALFASRRTLGGWSARLAATAAGTLLSPAGWRLYPYALATERANVASEEWQPLFTRSTWEFRPALPVLAALLIAALLGAAVVARRKRSGAAPGFPSPATGLLFLALAAQHRRMAAFLFVPLLALVGIARELGWLSRLEALLAGSRPALARLLRIAVLAATLAIAARQALIAARSPDLRSENYPLAAAEMMAGAQLDGRSLSPFEWGGFLAWRLHPAVRTFADGRWVEVGTTTLADGVRLLGHRADGSLYAHYGIDYFCQPTSDYFSLPPLPAREWRLVWIDPVAVVLARAGPSLDRRLAAICAYRRAHASLAEHFEWPFRLAGDRQRTGIPGLACAPL